MKSVSRNEDYERPNLERRHIALDDEHKIVVNSMRRNRRLFVVMVTTFLFGSLLILFNSPLRNDILAPGPLSDPHAQLLVGADRCTACHDAGHQTFTGWVANLWRGHSKLVGQSEKCMECHDKSITPSLALNAHNQPVETLKELTQAKKSSSFRLASFGHTHKREQSIACRSCHQEHHGNEGLNLLTDRQCQSCHSSVYHSFENDHPEFSNWPFPAGTQIAFDHVSHSKKHFIEKGQDFSCARCHQQDTSGNIQLLTDFGQACASCHESGIQASGQSGLTLLQVPMIDVDVFQNAGMTVGSWPTNASNGFEGTIPPLMQILLAADQDVALSLDALGEDFDFVDLDPDDKSKLRHAHTIVLGIKKLFHRLANVGMDDLKQRLETVNGMTLESEVWRKLSNGLNRQIFSEMVAYWWPDLEAELAFSTKPFLPDRTAELDEISRIFAQYRSSIDDEKQLVENPLRHLIKRSANSDSGQNQSSTDPPQKSSTDASPKIRTPQVRILNPQKSAETIPNQKDKTLVENPMLDLLRNDKTPRPIVKNLPLNIDHPKTELTIENMPKPKRIRRRASAVPVGAMQGWLRDDTILALKYQPTGHADPVLQGWLESLSSRRCVDTWVGTRPAFEALTRTTGIGECRKCHTMEKLPKGDFLIHWNAAQRDPHVRKFTKFNHQPHLTTTTLRDCKNCHRLDERSVNAELFQDFDPSTYVSNFEPIQKTDCATCHRQGGAPNGCSTCHHYHVNAAPVPTNQPVPNEGVPKSSRVAAFGAGAWGSTNQRSSSITDNKTQIETSSAKDQLIKIFID